MKRWLLILAGLTVIWSHFSFSQSSTSRKSADPFERYLASVKAQTQEPSLKRFAADCEIDLEPARARFAVSAGGDWKLVNNLASGLYGLETDFYTTAEFWLVGNRVLVEMWPNDDSAGEDTRIYACYVNGILQQGEVIMWNIPQDPGPAYRTWGYFRRWERDGRDRLHVTESGFVDAQERSIAKPKLDPGEEKNLTWVPSFATLRELRLPAELFSSNFAPKP